MIIMKEEVFTHNSLEIQAQSITQGHMGKHQGQSGGRRSWRKTWARVFIAVSKGRKEWERQGKEAEDWVV